MAGRVRFAADVVKRAVREFVADDCVGLAKQVAYSTLLAFFPAIVALVGLLGLVGAYDSLIEFLDPVAPAAITRLIETFGEDTARGGSAVALAIGLGGALWAASGAMGAVIKTVNRAYDLEETRPFWQVRLIGLVLVLSAAAVTAGMLLLVVLGGTIGEAIAVRARLGDEFRWVWDLARWPFAFCTVLALFALVYTLAPNRRPLRVRLVTAGSLLGSVLWLGLSALFALYTAYSDSYTRTYGTLAAGVILLLWLNYSAWAILFGAELDAEIERARDEARDRREAAREPEPD